MRKVILFPVLKGGKYGLMDKTGNLIVEPQFDDIFRIVDEMTACMIGGKWGFVNKEGRVVIEPRYETVYGFNEGLAAVEVTDGK